MNRRRLLLNLRRTINPYRRFSVEHVEGDRVRYTCRTCGLARVKKFGNAKVQRFSDRPIAEDLVKKMVRYQNSGGGANGHCSRCTKAARDSAHPLDGVSP